MKMLSLVYKRDGEATGRVACDEAGVYTCSNKHRYIVVYTITASLITHLIFHTSLLKSEETVYLLWILTAIPYKGYTLYALL